MAKRGRPTAFEPEFIEQAKKLCKFGATDLELADFFKVAISTLHRWKIQIPEFSDALKEAKEPVDDRVQRSLYHRAIGYSFDSEKIAINSQGEVTRVPCREHVPPDTTACIFWLKNRRKEQWRDRHEYEVGGPGDFERMNDTELRQFLAREVAKLSGGIAGASEPGDSSPPLGSGRLN